MGTIDEARRRVGTGADCLDLRGPEDWSHRIDLNLLDLDSDRWCVVGQVFACSEYDDEAFARGLESLDNPDPSHCGFDGVGPAFRAVLEDEWCRVILERRHERPKAATS
jgi:hypothetical protein